MKIALAAFSANGISLMQRVSVMLGGKMFAPSSHTQSSVEPIGALAVWVARTFATYDALVFIGAAGIAVRAIAPHVKNKLTDPAVVVMDELGRHVIPILSGHIGGANDLALRIAAFTGAVPAITTATDIHGVPAIDSWAVRNDIAIENPEVIKHLSAAVLEGTNVGVAITERSIVPPFPITLILRPRTLVVGVGCRRGIEIDQLENCMMMFLQQCQVSLLSLKALASIDLKADEPALLRLSEKYRLPLHTYSADRLRAADGIFSHSDRVEQAVGVGNVCERAAVLCAGGRLLWGKTTYPSVALALAGVEENL